MAKSRSKSNASSKADRKLEKKLDFYSKVRERVATLNAQKTITKKKRLRSRQKNLTVFNLSSLSDVLPELEALDQKLNSANTKLPANTKLNCKSRKTIILKEAAQLRAVLDNPAFHSDPLAAIHMHLQRTQPVMEEEPKKKDKSGEKDKKKKKKSKDKKKLKSSDGPQTMDT